MKSKWLLSCAGILGAISVALGAFGAHGLKKLISPEMLAVYQTGVTYQFTHTIAIALCGLLLLVPMVTDKARKYFFFAAICFIIGVFCFSGSLYMLALTGAKWFGPVTPFGGLLFIVGWCLFSYAATQIKEVSK